MFKQNCYINIIHLPHPRVNIKHKIDAKYLVLVNKCKKDIELESMSFLFCKIKFLLSKFDVNHALLQRLGEFSIHVSKQRSRWVEGDTTRGNDGR